MDNILDLAGIGIGPFNLSLAAVSEKNKFLKTHFFDEKPLFQWHSEIIFPDSDMQTAFLKDLVTGVDPTSPYSFLNYLVQNGLFHSFMNTNRNVVTRKEFELYCQWVAQQMPEKLSFNSKIETLRYDGKFFTIENKEKKFKTKNICIGTGISPKIPAFTVPYISKTFFHAKSAFLESLNTHNKSIVIIGGGQTGIEVFRNILKEKWGCAESVTLVSSRPNLEPLDESAFTNEYFSPNYAEDFFTINIELKKQIVNYQKLSSDGNTPAYLQNLYNELYYAQNVVNSQINFKILPYRRLESVSNTNSYYELCLSNHFTQKKERLNADIVILCTGFENSIPKFINSIKHYIHFDESNCFQVNKDFSIQWEGSVNNKIFVQNFSRYEHGIFEPQTSLMAWRSAVITNAISQKTIYQINNFAPNFLSYESV
ncbi:lysine N(6)-hydroxylase/L-ornithine N(5)-oxygenase family protein [Nitrosomonas aestuarii]|uniref:lysine N(6)-hydroxylase/L-ornithine N(5)-oxygenase family protein n=1 Tax=Nitrosomonas aestuarii TaxID=52441 RepID=UPI000D305B3F|nr:SidA/IucD/PvdA family monooxygenase [Nitrosomonas aestuarii]PTN13076.1 lysine N6-hydroxylase [Nitrosomonas aestuarii]